MSDAPHDSRHDEARRMRADGMTLRAVAERFGVATSTIMRWTDDAYADRARALCRANKLRYRGACVDCGTATIGDSPGHAPERCVPCSRAHGRLLTRAWILDSFAQWFALFGQVPVAAEWSPAAARTTGRDDYLDRRESTGQPWPNPSTVIDHFGSWQKGIAAAGFTPTPPGNYRDEASRQAVMRSAAGTAERRAEIAALYREGLTYREIGAVMGVSTQTIGCHISRMRAEGWDLPSRAPGPKVTA